MDRREFLKLSTGALIAAQLPWPVWAKVKRNISKFQPLNIREIEIPIGLEKPFSALHVSDTHITLVDNRDNERKIKLAAGRARSMNLGEHYLGEAIRHAKEHNMLLLHTGDMIDFVSEANLDAAARHYCEADWFVSAGNHEFSQFVGEAKEDEAYKAESFQKVQEAFPNDLTFCSRIYNGVNFVSLDDVYYNVTERQHELMELEVKRGLPIVLMCHVPFYTKDFCEYSLKQTPQCAYLAAVPLDITKNFANDPTLPEEQQWRNRSVQQRAEKPTLEFAKWLKDQKLVKGILTGHMHFFYETRYSKTAMQYTVGATYLGDAYAVKFV